LRVLKYSASSSKGRNVDAYIIDTGIYVGNNDFVTKTAGTTQFLFKASTGWSDTDGNGHGTHVASTTGGAIYGVAKECNLYAIKVLGDNGSGTNSGVIAGVDFVAARGGSNGRKSTANMSLGGSYSLALNQAVTGAVAQGITFVVAAGNSNADAANYSPASAPQAICVGATADGAGQDIRASYSNFGSLITVFAPGSSIKAAWIGSPSATNIISGTSMASPHVCGIATLLLGDDNYTPGQLKEEIVGTGNVGKINFDNCPTNACRTNSINNIAFNGCLN